MKDKYAIRQDLHGKEAYWKGKGEKDRQRARERVRAGRTDLSLRDTFAPVCRARYWLPCAKV